MTIQGHRTDGAECREFVLACHDAAQQLLQLLLAHRRAEVFVRDQLDALRAREFFRAFADQHDVRGFIHHQARQLDRILHVFEAGDRARAQRRAVHDGGIQLGDPVAIQDRATSRVEQGIVFQDTDRRDRGIEARSALLEQLVAGVERGLESIEILALLFDGQVATGQHAGAAVNCDCVHESSSKPHNRSACERYQHRKLALRVKNKVSERRGDSPLWGQSPLRFRVPGNHIRRSHSC